MEFSREPASSCYSSLLASWMIGQISASNQLRTGSELAPNMFGASSELASVMEFGFNQPTNQPAISSRVRLVAHSCWQLVAQPEFCLQPVYTLCKWTRVDRALLTASNRPTQTHQFTVLRTTRYQAGFCVRGYTNRSSAVVPSVLRNISNNII